MKRILLALMAIVLMAGGANAQARFGIKAGANFNKIKYSNIKNMNLDGSSGFNVGVMGEFTVPIIGLNFDAALMYSRMNNAISQDVEANEVGDKDVTWGKNFLEIPINIKYKFNLPVVSNFLSPYIFTGPSFAFKLDKSMRDKTFQAAWNIGIGVELIHHLQISGSYGFGINNIMDKVLESTPTLEGFNTSEIKAHNNYWTVSAAWLF